MTTIEVRTDDWVIIETDAKLDADRAADLKLALGDAIDHNPDKVLVIVGAKIHVLRKVDA